MWPSDAILKVVQRSKYITRYVVGTFCPPLGVIKRLFFFFSRFNVTKVYSLVPSSTALVAAEKKNAVVTVEEKISVAVT